MNRHVWLSLTLLAAAACTSASDGGTTAPAAPVASVTVALTSNTLTVGATGSATVTLRDAAGNTLSGRSVSWSSSNQNVVNVSENGTITTLAVGTTTITVTSEGKTGSAQLTVNPPPVASIVVQLAPSTISTGQTASATAVLRDASGNVLTGRTVTWSSSAAGVASVSATGTITALAAGSADIVATSEGKTGSAQLTVILAPVASIQVELSASVLAPGANANATAVLRDASGNALTGRTISWSSSTSNVATISENGTITALAVGTTTITATSEGKTGSALLTVNPPPVASVVVQLAPSTISTGQTANATAVLRDASGNVLTGRAVEWSTNTSGVASVGANGVVTAIAPGSATITATSEGKFGSATINVVLPPVASVTVTGAARVKVGDNYTYTATARLADGTIVNRAMSWRVSDPARATMTTGGGLTPLQPGSITLIVTIDGVDWTATTTAYDWETLNISGSSFVYLPSDNLITNKFGTSEYPDLVFVCSSLGYFFAWVSTQNFVTQNGLVAYSFDGGTIFTQLWDESSDFSTLFHPGNNLGVKNFAALVAASRVFTFAFTEFLSSARAMTFRVTGLTPRLQPLLAACPSNALDVNVAAMGGAASDRESMANSLRQRVPPSEVLSAARALRAARGALRSSVPALPSALPAMLHEQDAKRR